MRKRILSLILVLSIMLSLIVSLSAVASAESIANGTCGDNLTWTLDSSGNLLIIGDGDMHNYTHSSYTPWYDFQFDIIMT